MKTITRKCYINLVGKAKGENKVKVERLKKEIEPVKRKNDVLILKILRKPLIHMILIILLGILAYSNTFNVPFQFDDKLNIVDNSGLRSLDNFWPPSGSRWLGFLTFAINYRLGGLDTIGYHIVNLIIHILNAILIYWFVRLTFETPFLKSQNSEPGAEINANHLVALLSGLIFAVHPIQTQAVTYIVQRFTSLATLFYLLSLVMYIKFRSQQSAISGQQKLHATRYTLYAVSLISAVLAMKTKEISFTLPVIIILYEFCFFKSQNHELRTMNLKRLLYLMPFLLTLFIIPLSIVGIDKPVGDAIGELRAAAQETEEIPRWSYLFTQFRVIVTYIRLLFLPVNQSIDYDYPIYHSFFEPEIILSALFLLSLFSIGIYLFHRSRFSSHNLRFISFGIFWFFATLSIESSIIPISDVIFEHRLYLPGAGVFIAVTTAMFAIPAKIKNKFQKAKKIFLPAFALIILVLTFATYLRNTVWHEEITLWEDVVRKNPKNARGYNMIGIIHKNHGEIDKAISLYQMAIRIKPDSAETHVNLGSAYVKKGMMDEALKEFMLALNLHSLDPIDTAALYANLGTYYLKKGLPDKSIEYYRYALDLFPEDAGMYFNLGIAYNAKGWNDKAAEYINKAHLLNPERY